MGTLIDVLASLSVGLLLCLFPFFVAIGMEHVAVIERYPLHARIPGLMMNSALLLLGPGLVWPLQRLWDWLGIKTLVTVPLWDWLSPLGTAGYVLQILVLLMVADFLAYWRHRAEHGWFWPIHAVHHSPTELHAANDFGHPLQNLVNMLFVMLPMSIVQFDGPTTPWVVYYLVTLASIYIHSPIDIHFGPLRKVLVDNRFHRIHHSIEPRHFDRNFGITFSLWDRMFGTAYDPAPDEWPKVGLAGIAPPRTITDFLSLPVRVIEATRAARRPGQPLAAAADGRGVLSREMAAATALASAPTVNGLRSNS